MAYKQKKSMIAGTDPVKKAKKKIGPKVDPDAPGTPGESGYEPPVKRSDLDKKGKKLWDSKHKCPKCGKLKSQCGCNY
jgi:hypothetical protein